MIRRSLIKLTLITAQKQEGLSRKEYTWTLSGTSFLALNTILGASALKEYKGYAVSLYQPGESTIGYRFQIRIKELPELFNSYDVGQWIQVIMSQKWEYALVTHVCIRPDMKRLNNLLTVFLTIDILDNWSAENKRFTNKDETTVHYRRYLEHPVPARSKKTEFLNFGESLTDFFLTNFLTEISKVWNLGRRTNIWFKIKTKHYACSKAVKLSPQGLIFKEIIPNG